MLGACPVAVAVAGLLFDVNFGAGDCVDFVNVKRGFSPIDSRTAPLLLRRVVEYGYKYTYVQELNS